MATNCQFEYRFTINCIDPPPSGNNYDCTKPLGSSQHICVVDPNGPYTPITAAWGGYASALSQCLSDPNSPCHIPISQDYRCLGTDPSNGLHICVPDPNGYYTDALAAPLGYTDALHYCTNDPNAVVPCTDPFAFGCINPCACNYNPNATVDDGTCIYPCSQLPYVEPNEMYYLNANSALCQGDPNCNGVNSAMLSGGVVNGLAAGTWFPNNEMGIQTIIANPNRGIDFDFQGLKFVRNDPAHDNGPTDHMNLRVGHVDLNNWYGYPHYYFNWRDYIDDAVATGIFTGANGTRPSTDLIDTSLANTIDRDPNGYNIDLVEVNQIILTTFQAQCAHDTSLNIQSGACLSMGITNCFAMFPNEHIDCDRTNSTQCPDPDCVVPSTNPLPVPGVGCAWMSCFPNC